MNHKVDEVMSKEIVTAMPHHTIGHIKERMEGSNVGCIPIVSPSEEPIGVISTKDLISHNENDLQVTDVMSKEVYTIQPYADVKTAAKLMIKHQVHHLVVSSDVKVEGVLSSYDLLKLIEEA